jgi:isopropylmalate/homocitrate/citramalate synthase
MMLPKKVNLFEVGPRDGLQNQPELVSVEDKVELINRLSKTGLKHIEAGSFVSPKWVPQMASSHEVLLRITKHANVVYSALTPNLKGLDAALEVGVKEIAVFAAASESFSKKNINCTIDQSIKRFVPLVEKALAQGVAVRAYVSCVVGCPYEGDISNSKVADVSKKLLDLGCYEVSLGDTIGVGTPLKIQSMIETVANKVPLEQLAIHCHDTYGQAIANIVAALQSGVTTIDSSVAGLGGCPYAKGASGNVATEDVIYLFQGMGIDSGVDLNAIVEVGNFISAKLGRTNQSKVGLALGS